MLGLSNYVWCQSVSEDMLAFYKQVKPTGIALWGGPNFPMNEVHKAKRYLLDRPYLDFYVPYEGEIPTLNIARTFLESNRSIQDLKRQRAEASTARSSPPTPGS